MTVKGLDEKGEADPKDFFLAPEIVEAGSRYVSAYLLGASAMLHALTVRMKEMHSSGKLESNSAMPILRVIIELTQQLEAKGK